MKSSFQWWAFVPIFTQKNLVLMQLVNFHNFKNSDFWRHCIASVILVTVMFFFIQWMWFGFRKHIVKTKSAYPLWREFLGQILTNARAIGIVLTWLVFVSLLFASLAWGADFFREESVAHFAQYLMLSLLLNFYLAALFVVWHLLLAPRLALSSHAKLNP